MKKFIVEIELTDEEIKLLKSICWDDILPKEPYGHTQTEINSLCNKGVIEYVIDNWNSDYGLFLTSAGKQIILLI